MTDSSTKKPAYLVFDAKCVPDGELIKRVKYPETDLAADEAIDRLRDEIKTNTGGKADFLPNSFRYPVSICVARLDADFSLRAVTLLDEPSYRPKEMVADFWRGMTHYDASLVSYSGRTTSMPVLELAALRFGISAPGHFSEKFGRRYRFGSAHLDLHDWFSNHGASPVVGGLHLLSQLLGKPGRSGLGGEEILNLHRAGMIDKINDACLFDVLDTYFVFLRSRVMTAEIDLGQEQGLVLKAKGWIESQLGEHPCLEKYLENWGDWDPWV